MSSVKPASECGIQSFSRWATSRMSQGSAVLMAQSRQYASGQGESIVVEQTGHSSGRGPGSVSRWARSCLRHVGHWMMRTARTSVVVSVRFYEVPVAGWSRPEFSIEAAIAPSEKTVTGPSSDTTKTTVRGSSKENRRAYPWRVPRPGRVPMRSADRSEPRRWTPVSSTLPWWSTIVAPSI